ncbi:hypothetical protein MN032_11870 [Agromyces atrinae]|uniref:hypothetical protein n=1 Tax=Agromyces atrinae TaxID=592376 RepID=UPI001F56026D|nr:hypothetical protein [Agromyces atrinae]MCI2958391.1 hypothetical protein [Agromyces atrinae]
MRTYQGGLRLLDARIGSFDVVTTVWGSLVSIASSSPVVVASLIALAWDVTRGTKRLADRWVGSALDTNHDGPPVLQAPTAGEPWGVQHTKAFIPVLDAAIADGRGVEYFLDEADRTLKITVLPKDLGER